MQRRSRTGPSRLRLRRRLLLISTPVAIVMLLAAVKLVSVVIAGNAAVSDFDRRDLEALRTDVAVLETLDIIDTDKTALAQGSLAALEGDLQQADTRFTDLLSRSDGARVCPLRVDLELIRETHGDIAGWDGNIETARERYRSALRVIEDAPTGCFEGNSDPDPERRAVRNDAAARLVSKINNLGSQPPPPPPAPPLVAAAPPPPPPAAANTVGPEGRPDDQPAPELRLEPTLGNPIDRLQEALGDAEGSRR